MSFQRGRGRPTRQSMHVPDDGFVTINVDSMREDLSVYMAQQAPGTQLAVALRELIIMGLAVCPEDAAIHLERRKAHQQAQRYMYRAIAAFFATTLHDLEDTSVLIDEELSTPEGT